MRTKTKNIRRIQNVQNGGDESDEDGPLFCDPDAQSSRSQSSDLDGWKEMYNDPGGEDDGLQGTSLYFPAEENSAGNSADSFSQKIKAEEDDRDEEFDGFADEHPETEKNPVAFYPLDNRLRKQVKVSSPEDAKNVGGRIKEDSTSSNFQVKEEPLGLSADCDHDDRDNGFDMRNCAVHYTQPQCFNMLAPNSLHSLKHVKNEVDSDFEHKSAHGMQTQIPEIKKETFDCLVCGKIFRTASSRNGHMRTHKDGRETGSDDQVTHDCSLCERKFTTESSLRMHERKKHQLGSDGYRCQVCAKKFNKKSVLDRHLISHVKKEPYACDKCDKTYRLKVHLKAHYRFIHMKDKVYRCTKCPLKFDQYRLYREHLVTTHMKGKVHHCSKCSKTFPWQNQLMTHMQMHHGAKERPFQCSSCDYCFMTQSNLDRHYKIVHLRIKPHTCPVCQVEYTSKYRLGRHLASTHDNYKIHECQVCDKSFANRKELSDHYGEYHPERKKKRHSCPLCDRLFRSPSRVTRHLYVHTGFRPFICEICSQGFYSKKEQQVHMLTLHKREIQNLGGSFTDSDMTEHTCDICKKSFLFKHRLNRHMKTHSNERPHKCLKCEKAFLLPRDLRMHMLVHNKTVDYYCAICNKKFSYQRTLEVHMAKHDSPLAMPCTFCDARFISKREMGIHIHQVHSEQKLPPLTKEERKKLGKKRICLTCGQEFRNKQNLWHHKNRMHNIRSHSCNECDKVFASKKDLQVHLRCHTGEKPFVCTVCNKAFRQKGHLSVHMRSHTGEKPYRCTICEKGFVVKTGLDKHLRMHARREEEQRIAKEQAEALQQKILMNPELIPELSLGGLAGDTIGVISSVENTTLENDSVNFAEEENSPNLSLPLLSTIKRQIACGGESLQDCQND